MSVLCVGVLCVCVVRRWLVRVCSVYGVRLIDAIRIVMIFAQNS